MASVTTIIVKHANQLGPYLRRSRRSSTKSTRLSHLSDHLPQALADGLSVPHRMRPRLTTAARTAMTTRSTDAIAIGSETESGNATLGATVPT